MGVPVNWLMFEFVKAVRGGGFVDWFVFLLCAGGRVLLNVCVGGWVFLNVCVGDRVFQNVCVGGRVVLVLCAGGRVFQDV